MVTENRPAAYVFRQLQYIVEHSAASTTKQIATMEQLTDAKWVKKLQFYSSMLC